MEFIDFVKLLKKYKIFLIVFIVAVLVLTNLVVLLRRKVYNASISFSINPIDQELTADFKYNGYYALLASESVADTVESWFSTPSFVQKVYEIAEIDSNIKNVSDFKRKFKAKKVSSQNVLISYKNKNEEDAKKLGESMNQLVKEKVEELNRNSEDKALYEVLGSKPVIAVASLSLVLVNLIALAVAFIAGVFVVSLRDYKYE